MTEEERRIHALRLANEAIENVDLRAVSEEDDETASASEEDILAIHFLITTAISATFQAPGTAALG